MLSILKNSLLFLILLKTAAMSHAHIFVDYKLHAIVNESGISGVYVNWTFDPMFAAMVKEDFDLDQNNKLSKEEQMQVYEKSFKEWKQGDYFIVLKENEEKIAVPIAEKFSARLTQQGNAVEYSFFIPLDIKAGDTKKDLHILFIDPVIYVDFATTKESITVANKAKESIEVSTMVGKVDFSSITTYSITRKQ